MKRLLRTLPLLLLMACSSSGFSDAQLLPADSEVQLEIVGTDFPMLTRADERAPATVQIEVTNNSDADITIKTIRVEPQMSMRDDTNQIDAGSISVNAVVGEGKDARFRVSMMVQRTSSMTAGGYRGDISLRVVAYLDDGRAYYAEFSVPSQL
ncbi:MAG TPA: hypothetical protein VFN10_06850 [Thermoanaerobaculia bacterium]|nr:hypothetical protein [Thermoanaerobaculia bacterium]